MTLIPILYINARVRKLLVLKENIDNLQLPQGTDIFIYEVDVCLVLRGAQKMANMQKTVNIISDISEEPSVKVNTGKTKVMMIKAKSPLQPLPLGQKPIE